MNQLDFKNSSIHEYGLAALETDIFRPMGLYAGDEGKSVVFDSGYTLAVSPFDSDFQGPINPVNKEVNGLGAKEQVTGE